MSPQDEQRAIDQNFVTQLNHCTNMTTEQRFEQFLAEGRILENEKYIQSLIDENHLVNINFFL